MTKPKLGQILLSGMFYVFVTTTASGGDQGFTDEVINADAGKPAVGVWAIVAREECFGFAHCSTSCVEVHAAKSRGVTKFPIPWWRSTDSYKTYVYKRGFYDDILTIKPYHFRLVLSTKPSMNWTVRYGSVPDIDPVSMRTAYLSQVARAGDCYDASASQRAELIPFYKDLLDEGWAISQIPEHREDLQGICRALYNASGDDFKTYSSDEDRDARMRAHLEKTEPKCVEKLDFSERDRLFNAVKAHDLNAVSSLLSDPIDAARRARRLNPALVTATLSGDEAMMRLLLARGADPNTRANYSISGIDTQQENGWLLSAVLNDRGLPEARQLELAELLLSSGADPNRVDSWGYTPFQRACRGDRADVVALILKHGASVNLKVACMLCLDRDQLPLQLATNVEITKKLIDAGADVNATGKDGTTALHYVSSPEIAQLLIAKGANVNAVYADGRTPLMVDLQLYEQFRYNLASAEKYRQIAELLVRNGARLDIKIRSGIDAFRFTSDDKLKADLTAIAQAQKK
ncbi:MAG: ankyrin repeat domain-containing protein [Sulfuricaulis sp.]